MFKCIHSTFILIFPKSPETGSKACKQEKKSKRMDSSSAVMEAQKAASVEVALPYVDLKRALTWHLYSSLQLFW